MVMSTREAAGVLAQCKWLRDQIRRWEDAAKDVLAQQLTAGERVAAIAPDGTELGMVTRTRGARAMKVDNEAGFLAWVKQRYPTEVEEIVRPAFTKLCAEKVKQLGALPDANGEMCPHVSLDASEPWNMVKLSDEAGVQMLRMILQHKLMEVVTPPSELFTDRGDVQLTQYEGMPWVDTPEEAAMETTAMDEIYDEPMDDVTQAQIDYIQEGPPNWQESNTFETSDEVKRRR